MSNTSAELKGSLFPLSVLQLEDVDLTKLQSQLTNKLAQAPSFFFRAPLVINIEKINDDALDFATLKRIVEENDFICVGVCNGTTTQKKQARIAGLAALNQPKHQQSSQKTEEKSPEQAIPGPERAITKIVRQNIRSGQQIYAKNCDLVIIGSVSNGAEVIADGDIHIYGSLRGRAIAGAAGNKQAAIFSQSIEAELVSIAGTYWLSESLQTSIWKKSGVVKLDQEQLTIEPLVTIQN
jgi:septum site-determining protein MinC